MILRATSYWWVSTRRRPASFNYKSISPQFISHSAQFMLHGMKAVLQLSTSIGTKKSSKIFGNMGPKVWKYCFSLGHHIRTTSSTHISIYTYLYVCIITWLDNPYDLSLFYSHIVLTYFKLYSISYVFLILKKLCVCTLY